MKSKILNIILIVLITLLVWIGISWFDVVIHNIGSYEFSDWNLFKIVFNP